MGHTTSVSSNALSLQEYCALLSQTPRPSEQQVADFVTFVCSAHSWYKHIAYHLPGVPFQFFVDPLAGFEIAISWAGTVKFAPRVEQGFHHSWIPTQKYREQFGCLAYSCDASLRAVDVRWFGRKVSADCRPTILGREGKLRALPSEILEAGRAHLTAAIHTMSAGFDFWDIWQPSEPLDNVWPEESGGQEALEKIILRCRKMRQSQFKTISASILFDTWVARLNEDPNLNHVDAELYALVAPEQKRQRQLMTTAMTRVCDLVWR